LLSVPLLAFEVAQVADLRWAALHEFRDPLDFPVDPRDFRKDLAGRIEAAYFDIARRAHNSKKANKSVERTATRAVLVVFVTAFGVAVSHFCVLRKKEEESEMSRKGDSYSHFGPFS
jgi:hypothetical protein